MGKSKTRVKKIAKKKPGVAKIRAAIAKLVEFGFGQEVRRVDGHEAHVIISALQRAFPHLIVIAEAAEAGMLHVKR